MEDKLKLFMVMLGCTPKGRFTEQHDIFFGIGNNLKTLLPEMQAFWPEAKGKTHIDAWREVTFIDGFEITVVEKVQSDETKNEQLFFINLGGYKENEFEEYHYKTLVVAQNLALATKKAKSSSFYKHFGFKGATSHIDDKYGIDVDDFHNLNDVLNKNYKEKYSLIIKENPNTKATDVLHIGYLKISKLV
jgi:Domain of Unknown Function (DUF1543)